MIPNEDYVLLETNTCFGNTVFSFADDYDVLRGGVSNI